MSQLPISTANSTNFHAVSLTNGIPFALGDVAFIYIEKHVCVSSFCLQGKNKTVMQHPAQ